MYFWRLYHKVSAAFSSVTLVLFLRIVYLESENFLELGQRSNLPLILYGKFSKNTKFYIFNTKFHIFSIFIFDGRTLRAYTLGDNNPIIFCSWNIACKKEDKIFLVLTVWILLMRPIHWSLSNIKQKFFFCLLLTPYNRKGWSYGGMLLKYALILSTDN